MSGKNKAAILAFVGLTLVSIVVLRTAQTQSNRVQEENLTVASSLTNQSNIKLLKRVKTSDQTSVNTIQLDQSIYEIYINCQEDWNSRVKKNDKISNDIPPDQEVQLVRDICNGRLH